MEGVVFIHVSEHGLLTFFFFFFRWLGGWLVGVHALGFFVFFIGFHLSFFIMLLRVKFAGPLRWLLLVGVEYMERSRINKGKIKKNQPIRLS